MASLGTVVGAVELKLGEGLEGSEGSEGSEGTDGTDGFTGQTNLQHSLSPYPP